MEIILPLFGMYIVVVLSYDYSRRLVILFLPLHMQTFYLAVSSLSLSRTLNAGEILFFITYFVVITSIVMLWSSLFGAATVKFRKLFQIIRDHYSLPLIYVVFILIILYMLMYLLNPDAIFKPRETHKALMEGNKGGSLFFSLIAIPAALASLYCVKFSNLILMSGFLYFLGSKGFIINCWIFYLAYITFFEGKSSFGVILIAVPAFYGFINMNISGVENALYYLLFSYFDYAANIVSVLEVPLFINLDIFSFVANEFVVGFSRISGVQRIDLFQHYFPYEVSVGKNPGLLDAEIVFRGGYIFGWLLLFFKYSFIYVIARLSLNSGLVFVAAATLVTVSIKITIALLLLLSFGKLMKRI